MKKEAYQITGLTIAVREMDAMLRFYSDLFGIQFREQDMYGTKLYTGLWGNMELLFCPAEVAQNTAQQNRHQFDIEVPDLQALILRATQCGGLLMAPVSETESYRSVGIYDPDRNSLVFRQKRSKTT